MIAKCNGVASFLHQTVTFQKETQYAIHLPVSLPQRSCPGIQNLLQLRLGREQVANNSRQKMFRRMMKDVITSVATNYFVIEGDTANVSKARRNVLVLTCCQ